MVYQIFNDGIESSTSSKKFKIKQQHKKKKPSVQSKSSHTNSTWSLYATNLLIAIIKLVLVLYDVISLPIYFILQRPDKRAKESQRTRSHQVDANTWIQSSQTNSDHYNYNYNYGLDFFSSLFSWFSGGPNKYKWPLSSQHYCPKPMQLKFMGATMSEIFTNAVRENHSKSCLGYRAVVTCPMFTQNETGQHVLEEKSFRSDYTWYTYGQIGRRVQDIASGLYYHSVYPTSRAMFMASTCLEWFCSAQACFQLAIELVLVPDISDPKTLESILAEAQVQVLFVSCDQLEKLCKLLDFISDRAENDRQDPLDNNNEQDEGPTKQQQQQTQSKPSATSFSLKRIIMIDWQFSIDFDEQPFQQLGKSIERCVPAAANQLKVLSVGQIEEAGIENPIELRCSSAISEENLFLDNKFNGPNQQQQQKQNQVSTSRYFNFSSNSNGIQWPPKKRKISGPPEVTGTRGNSETTCSDDSRGILKISSVPLRRRGHAAASELEGKCCEDENKQDSNCGGDGSDRASFNTLTNKVVDSSKAPRPDDLALVVYTYGSLGQLKPITLTHRQLARSSGQMFLDGMIGSDEVHCTILSLDSVIELMIETCVLSHGGSIGYSCNLQTYFHDGTDLFPRDKSDLEALEPSFLLVRPYILERLRHSVRNYLQMDLNPIISFVFKNVLYDYKKYWARRHFNTPIIDRIFCSKLKTLFGQRIKYILCNGSTDCHETKDFFAFMLNLPVIELYGPEEAIVSLMSVNDTWDYKRHYNSTSKTRMNREKSGYGWRLFQFDDVSRGQADNIANTTTSDYLEDEEENPDDFQDLQLMPPTVNRNIYREDLSRNILIISSILYPTRGARIRLEDWEEFRITDLPYPRGRLVIGGDEIVCKGYLNRPALSRETFYVDSNGVSWFRTGDIARAFPNGCFEIISAISDMIKMVDGQFVSLSQIEQLIRSSQFVDNVCAICGEDRRFVINLVVPNLRRLALKSMGQADLEMAITMEPEPEELADIEFRREVCNDRLLCEFVSDHLNDLLGRYGLASTVTNRFLLVPEIWTPESELVMPAFRPKRAAIQKYYATDIQAIVQLEFGMSRARRLSARRQTTRSTTPHLQLTTSTTNSRSSLSSVNSI